MPLYEYTCQPCGETREVLARSAETTRPPACPRCGAEMARRWSPVAAVGLGGGTASCAAPAGSGFT